MEVQRTGHEQEQRVGAKRDPAPSSDGEEDGEADRLREEVPQVLRRRQRQKDRAQGMVDVSGDRR